MTEYLEQVKKWDLLYLWRRNKKEFVIIPMTLIDEEDVEILQSRYLREKIAESRKSERVSFDEVVESLGVDL